eukprot:GFYU01043607.1.p1 GENE.GFYU01043607.1~~GFYU01043607.1.p1  ORF type:complete len:208 (+),score=14.83 GFYU01043607.1:47-670(+)
MSVARAPSTFRRSRAGSAGASKTDYTAESDESSSTTTTTTTTTTSSTAEDVYVFVPAVSILAIQAWTKKKAKYWKTAGFALWYFITLVLVSEHVGAQWKLAGYETVQKIVRQVDANAAATVPYTDVVDKGQAYRWMATFVKTVYRDIGATNPRPDTFGSFNKIFGPIFLTNKLKGWEPCGTKTDGSESKFYELCQTGVCAASIVRAI